MSNEIEILSTKWAYNLLMMSKLYHSLIMDEGKCASTDDPQLSIRLLYFDVIVLTIFLDDAYNILDLRVRGVPHHCKYVLKVITRSFTRDDSC